MVRTGIGIGSGDLDLLEILLLGPDAWNQWRHDNPDSVINLRGANLSGANLSGAILSGAILRGANLSGAILSGAILRGANLRGAIISDETQIDKKWKLVHELVNIGGEGKNLSGANLSSANLRDANLSSADLRDANLSFAELSRADLSFANLSSAELNKTNFIGAKLIGANLSHANLSHANLSHANLIGANLSHANLSHANLSHANLSRADLSFAILSSAIISEETLIEKKWRPILNTETTSTPKTHYNFDIKVFDPDINSSEKEQLQAAIDRYAKSCGYEEITVISEKSGSWFKKIRYRIATLISQDIQEEAIQAGQEFYRSGKSFALNKLEKTGVESTKQIAEATAEILKAVENLDDVVLLLGKLIVMKYTNVDGRSKTYVKTISSDLQLKLESTPELLDSPQAIINFLKSQEELPPAIEEQKALPATPEPLK